MSTQIENPEGVRSFLKHALTMYFESKFSTKSLTRKNNYFLFSVQVTLEFGFLISNMVLPGSNRKSSALSIEANINESVQAVPAIVRDENKCKNIIKHTTRKSSFKREGKKEIECSTKRISDAVEDFKKFSDSLMEELEADYQQMFEQMKKELENLAALPNSTMQTIDNEGEGIQNSNHVPELTRTHSGMQL